MTTPTQIREAILKAADHIEGNPNMYDYGVNGAAINYGTPACMLGWTLFFLGKNTGNGFFDDGPTRRVMGVALGEFLCRCQNIDPDETFKVSATKAAEVLRLYAEKHHPEETCSEVQAELDRIFAGEVTV